MHLVLQGCSGVIWQQDFPGKVSLKSVKSAFCQFYSLSPETCDLTNKGVLRESRIQVRILL